MNGDDIQWSNSTMPAYPDGMPLWQKIMCLMGYHKSETRQTAPGHRYGNGRLHNDEPMKLRNQCGRCFKLL